MIYRGTISGHHHPYLKVKVKGVEKSISVNALFDSGNGGILCLPIYAAVSLGLVLCRTSSFELADGTIVEEDPVYRCKILWDNEWIDIDTETTRSNSALFGVSLPAQLGAEITIAYNSQLFLIRT